MELLSGPIIQILFILLIAVVAYYIITKFIEDATLRMVALLIVGLILLLKLLGVW